MHNTTLSLIVRPHLFVRKNPEKPKKVSVDLTGHTYEGRCKRLVCVALRVEFLLKTESGYLRDAEVT